MKRLFYPSPLMTAPSVMIVDVPVGCRGETLPLGRYYPIIIETDAERDEVVRALAAGCQNGCGLDLLDYRPSNIWSDHVLISRYDPSAPDWPWAAVVRWPIAYRDAASGQGISMARGCYTMELFATAAELEIHCAALLDGLGRQNPIDIRILAGDSLPSSGKA